MLPLWKLLVFLLCADTIGLLSLASVCSSEVWERFLHGRRRFRWAFALLFPWVLPLAALSLFLQRIRRRSAPWHAFLIGWLYGSALVLCFTGIEQNESALLAPLGMYFFCWVWILHMMSVGVPGNDDHQRDDDPDDGGGDGDGDRDRPDGPTPNGDAVEIYLRQVTRKG